MLRRVGLWPLQQVLTGWTPGDEWSWDVEAEELNTYPCFCATPTDEDGFLGEIELCPTPGHYQLRLVGQMRHLGGWFGSPALLGSDGRVWDGHQAGTDST